MKAFVIEWGIFIASIFLVFSPFIYLGFRKWRKNLAVSLWQVVGAYLLSIAIFPTWNWFILGKVDRFIYNNHQNLSWLQDAVSDPGFKMIFVGVIGWSLLAFYCGVLLKKNPYNLKHFIYSLISTLVLFGILTASTFYLMLIALGSIGRDYF